MGAHDSPYVRNVADLYTPFGDQFYDSFAQLDSGIRLLTWQLHPYGNTYHLCHTSCDFLDAGPASTWLSKLHAWLSTHPNDVVTLLIVNYYANANATVLNNLWSAAGLAQYGYVPASGIAPQKQWPTLNAMVDSGKRLVTFIASLDTGSNIVAPYLLDEFTFVFENAYDNRSPRAFNCDINRPSALATPPGQLESVLNAGYLPLMNHFLYDALGDSDIEASAPEHAAAINADSPTKLGSLGFAANNCTRVYGGKPPTFILGDFVNVGPALDTVDRLNGVKGKTSGRQVLPNTVAGSLH